MAKPHEIGPAATPLWSVSRSELHLTVGLQRPIRELATPGISSVDLTAAPDGVVSSSFRPYRFRTFGCLFSEGRSAFQKPESATIVRPPTDEPKTVRPESKNGKLRFTLLRPP